MIMKQNPIVQMLKAIIMMMPKMLAIEQRGAEKRYQVDGAELSA